MRAWPFRLLAGSSNTLLPSPYRAPNYGLLDGISAFVWISYVYAYKTGSRSTEQVVDCTQYRCPRVWKNSFWGVQTWRGVYRREEGCTQTWRGVYRRQEGCTDVKRGVQTSRGVYRRQEGCASQQTPASYSVPCSLGLEFESNGRDYVCWILSRVLWNVYISRSSHSGISVMVKLFLVQSV